MRNWLYKLALVLIIVGALNWGLIGLFEFDLVAYLFGGVAAGLSRTVYTLVCVGGLIAIPLLFVNYNRLDSNERRTEMS